MQSKTPVILKDTYKPYLGNIKFYKLPTLKDREDIENS